MPSRRRIFDITAVSIFVIVLAVLFWPAGSDEGEVDSAPDGVAEDLQTPTPDNATPIPSPPVDGDPDDLGQCGPGDSVQRLARFIVRFNDGNFESVSEMLPEEGFESHTSAVYPGMNQQILHGFRLHESGPLADPGQVLEYLMARHEAGEYWRLEDYSVERMHRNASDEDPELDQIRVLIHRTADDVQPHEVEGRVVVNCADGLIIFWELLNDDPDLAIPLMVDDFLSAVGPYGTSEMRDLRMIVTTDLRPDGGALEAWDIRRVEANAVTGSYVENVSVASLDGDAVIDYAYDGERWFMNQRGWQEVGDLTGWDVLPFEIMITRREPSVTAGLLREHLSEIPSEGRHVITGEFNVRDDLLEAYALHHDAESLEAVLEVEIEDGAVVRTHYRLVSEPAGLHFSVPEIRWVHMIRADRYDPRLFSRPEGFQPDAQQYSIPDDLSDSMTLVERSVHTEGIGEQYQFSWDGQPFELWVMPSRGGIGPQAGGDHWDPGWRPTRTVFDNLDIITAETATGVHPVGAIWDTGNYRYELSIDPGDITDPDGWGMDDLRAVVDALRE